MKLVINIQDEKLSYEFNDENTNNYTIDTFCSLENKSISSYIIKKQFTSYLISSDFDLISFLRYSIPDFGQYNAV